MNPIRPLLSLRGLVPLLIPPIYIAIVSLAERKWGPALSGRLTALPTQTSTIILIIALTESLAVAAGVAAGALLGIISLSAFSAGYGLTSRRHGWPGSLAVALAAFLVSALLIVQFHGGPAVDAIAAVGVVLVVLFILRRIELVQTVGRASTLGLPIRMGLATALVLLVAILVPYLGPLAAGTLGVFPILTTPMTVLNHRSAGAAASRTYLEGLEWGLIGGVAFFLTLTELLARDGIFLAFVTAIPLLVALQLVGFYAPRRYRPQVEA